MSHRHRPPRKPRRWPAPTLHLVIGAGALYLARWQYAATWPPSVVLIIACTSGALIFVGCMMAMESRD